MIAVHCLHRSLSSQFLAVWVLLRLLVGQPQHWSLLACSCRSMASTGRWSCEAGVKTAASSCNCLELLGGYLAGGVREIQALYCLNTLKFARKTIYFHVKTFILALFSFSFSQSFAAALLRERPSPAASQGSSWTSKGLQASQLVR